MTDHNITTAVSKEREEARRIATGLPRAHVSAEYKREAIPEIAALKEKT